MKAINSIHNTMAAVITVLFMTLLGMGAAGRIAAVETGGQADRQARILSAEDAVRLLGRFCPDTPPAVLREAAAAYGGDPNAVTLLGRLLQESYGGDASRWPQVNPQAGTTLEGLLAAALEVHSNNRELLDMIAVSLCPAPLEMLEALTGIEQESLRGRLGRLHNWQLVEFTGGETVDQNAVMRRYLAGRMEGEKKHGLLMRIADWWSLKSEKETPANPQEIDQLLPLLWAVEHLLEADEVERASDIFMTKQSSDSLYWPEEWLRQFGYLDENIRLNSRLIDGYKRLVFTESRRELRNDLAGAYNNRGDALRIQGNLAAAIDDLGRAITIYVELVEKEAKCELRNNLAVCYNNRGVALRDQGDLAGAIADYGWALATLEELREEESGHELKSDLAMVKNNRANALIAQGDLTGAIADYGKVIAIYEDLVKKEGRWELRSYLARAYNNRANALGEQVDQKDLGNAIADYGKVIKILEEMVELEGRRELKPDLGVSFFNRALAYEKEEKWDFACLDVEKGIVILQDLIREGQKHLLPMYLRSLGLRCKHVVEMGSSEATAVWVNEALSWLSDVQKAGMINTTLETDADRFLTAVRDQRKALRKVGLDEALLDAVIKAM